MINLGDEVPIYSKCRFGLQMRVKDVLVIRLNVDLWDRVAAKFLMSHTQLLLYL